MLSLSSPVAVAGELPVVSDPGLTRDESMTPRERFEAKLAWQAAHEPARYRAFAQSFVEAFNSADMAPIAETMAPSALEQLPAEKLLGFLGMLKSDSGAIETLRYKYLDRRSQRQPATPVAV